MPFSVSSGQQFVGYLQSTFTSACLCQRYGQHLRRSMLEQRSSDGEKMNRTAFPLILCFFFSSFLFLFFVSPTLPLPSPKCTCSLSPPPLSSLPLRVSPRIRKALPHHVCDAARRVFRPPLVLRPALPLLEHHWRESQLGPEDPRAARRDAPRLHGRGTPAPTATAAAAAAAAAFLALRCQWPVEPAATRLFRTAPALLQQSFAGGRGPKQTALRVVLLIEDND